MNIFEEVKGRLDVKQVIEGYGTKVDRKGHFICPFHNDTHPSASIKKDFFNCFVCGAGGDVITYTGKMFGLKNYDAAKKLIDDFDLNIKTEPLCVSEQLRAKRAYQKRLQQRKEEQTTSGHPGSRRNACLPHLWVRLLLFFYYFS